MSASLEVSIGYEPWSQLADAEPLALELLGLTIRHCKAKLHPRAEISVLLCDDAAIQALNRDWRKIDKATNVLSFPAPGPLKTRQLLGDVAIAYQTALAEAAAEDKTLRAHFAHLATHGYLHLLGFDHETPEEAETMEQAERAILAAAGFADPYAGAALLEAAAAS